MKSNHVSKLSLRFVATLLVMFSLVLFAGCSQSPTGTDSTESQVHVLTRMPADGAAFKVLSYYTSETISAKDGGIIELYDVTLEVPPGAVDTDTTFSIGIPDISVFYNEFGTSGLVFNVPVTVTMSFRDADLTGVDVSTIRIAYFNEESGQIEDVDCRVDFERQVVTAKLYHFSAYGLISDEQ
ncbi:MAG: hypothetical protein R3F48_03000 [Candidatus Zixiibacteriota bacterium]